MENTIKQNGLPTYAFVLLRTENRIVRVENGKQGYYETGIKPETNIEAQIERYNNEINVTPEQALEMEARSMFGNW